MRLISMISLSGEEINSLAFFYLIFVIIHNFKGNLKVL